jgi:hypothetical protein
MNLSETTSTEDPSVEEFYVVVKSRKDSRFLVHKKFSLSMVRDMPDSLINALEIDDLSKVLL